MSMSAIVKWILFAILVMWLLSILLKGMGKAKDAGKNLMGHLPHGNGPHPPHPGGPIQQGSYGMPNRNPLNPHLYGQQPGYGQQGYGQSGYGQIGYGQQMMNPQPGMMTPPMGQPGMMPPPMSRGAMADVRKNNDIYSFYKINIHAVPTEHKGIFGNKGLYASYTRLPEYQLRFFWLSPDNQIVDWDGVVINNVEIVTAMKQYIDANQQNAQQYNQQNAQQYNQQSNQQYNQQQAQQTAQSADKYSKENLRKNSFTSLQTVKPCVGDEVAMPLSQLLDKVMDNKPILISNEQMIAQIKESCSSNNLQRYNLTEPIIKHILWILLSAYTVLSQTQFEENVSKLSSDYNTNMNNLADSILRLLNGGF